MLEGPETTIASLRAYGEELDERAGVMPVGKPEFDRLMEEARDVDRKIMDTPATTPEEIAVRLEMIMDVMTTSGELSWWLDGMLKASIRDLKALH